MKERKWGVCTVCGYEYPLRFDESTEPTAFPTGLSWFDVGAA